MNRINGQFNPVLRGHSVLNLVTNGNFANGWVVPWGSDTAGTPTVNSEIVSFTSTAQFGRIKQSFDFVAGNKYFVSGLIKTTSNLVSLVLSGNVTSNNSSHSGNNTFELLSLTWIPTTDTSGIVAVTDYRVSGWTQIQATKLLVINMNALGLESLTTSGMNARFPTWFDGRKPAISLSKKIRSVAYQ